MSYTWTVTGRGFDLPPVHPDDTIRNTHVLACNVWTTNHKPCNCDQVQDAPPPPRLSTAERLDLIDAGPEPWLGEGA